MRQTARPFPRFLLAALLTPLLALPARASFVSARTPAAHAADSALGASISVPVDVPASMRSAPFDAPRSLTVPPNFSIAVYARVPGARFMAVTPDGNLLVSQPGAGKVELVRPNPNGDPVVSDFATGLSKPHDIVFHAVGGTTYVYISENTGVDRFAYNNGDTTAHDRQVVVSSLPDASLPELHGAYAHELKNIALDANDKLYVSIGSSCNACAEDTTSSPVRGAIYQYNADGTGGRLFARGLRNAEGLAFLPGTTTLWAAVNNRDNIACPPTSTDPGCPTGQVVQSYVDNHPPEEFTRVRDGGNYGWPFCNPSPDTAAGYDNMPFERDDQLNAGGGALNCDTADRIDKGIQAHSAPLGLTFLQGTAFPAPYQQGATIALHGSWNRQTKTGAKVIYFPFDGATGLPGAQADLVTGWIGADGNYWGRPVDTAVDPQGNLLISDDDSGTLYKLTYHSSAPPSATSAPPSATTMPAPPSATPAPPTASATTTSTPPTASATSVPPSATSVPPSATTMPAPPTATPRSSARQTMFATGFEGGDAQPAWNDTADFARNVRGVCCGLTHTESSTRQEIAHMGSTALMYSGWDTNANQSFAYNKVFDLRGKNITIKPSTTLSYWIYPQNGFVGAVGRNSVHVAIDMIFSDGSDLRDSGAVDQYGVRLHPQYQGDGGHLAVNTWNHVISTIGATVAGKTIDHILVGYDQPANTGPYRGYIDDIQING
jgi:glucose/arabinose dehydrogenase